MADSSLSELDLQKLLHGLQVQQADLERQNHELRSSKHKLERSLARYFELYDLAPVGYLTTSEQGLIMEANLTAASLFGVERAVLVKQSFFDYIHPDDQNMCFMHRSLLLSTGTPQKCELRLLKKDGGYIWVTLEAVATHERENGENVVRVVMVDISERKQVEEELKMSEERLRLALQAAEQGIYDLDVRTGEAIVTPEYARMLGYDPAEFQETNEKWIERLHPDDRDSVAAVYRAYVNGERPEYKIEFRQKTRCGSWKWILSLGKIMERDRDGNPLRMVGTHTDITGRKQLEDDLRQALENAKGINATMNRLLRVVAHEFRSPLGVLTGSTDILDRYGDRLEPEKRFAMHEHIRNSARQLNELVSSVLEFNRLGLDRPGNPPRLLDIGKSCSVIAAEIDTGWSAGQEYSVTIAEGCGVAMLDETLLRRIVENLLVNAFRYTPSTGSVSYYVKRDMNRLCMEISDTGIGIPEEEQELIFDAYYRCRNVEGRAGLGVGLFIVLDALKQMGGTITVDSRNGRGTTMRVNIPVTDGE